MKLEHILVININSPYDSIVSRLSSIPNIPSTNFNVLASINGWELEKGASCQYHYKVADWWKDDSSDYRFYNRNMTAGEIGCALSHYDAVKTAYNGGHANVLILEEDFVPLNYPTTDKFKELPSDWSMLYLGRHQNWSDDKEKNLGNHLTRVGYSYNNHAYILSRKGMKEVLDSGWLNNLIATDEFYPALHGTTDREDAAKIFHNKKFKAYSFREQYFNQTSNPKTNSLTEFEPIYDLSKNIEDKKPDWLDEFQAQRKIKPVDEKIDNKPPWIKTTGKSFKAEKEDKPKAKSFKSVLSKADVKTPKIPHELLNDNNWDEWCKLYINPAILNKEYDLIIDEPAPNVYVFPFFTKRFCKQLVSLGEQYEWTTDRHKFYPTTDNLLSVLGMEHIYNRLINDFVKPLAIDRYQLEGDTWNHLRDESFIIKYPHDQQAHLSLHHDHSNITTLVNLNPGEFEGGGTYFPKYKCNVNPKEIGVMTLHPGNITHKHGARAVTQGTRYVVVSFIKGAAHT
ncbi:MAG: glycosyltransferase family 25 protein [Flavobacteriales bacterium]|nr:glycosyltransferase family 25 protein [Flavobacteriales bacterium]